MKSVADLPLGKTAIVRDVQGPRAFRRRLLEMGLVPGTQVKVVAVAPLGDPLQVEVRDSQWSMRRSEAAQIAIELSSVANPDAGRDAATDGTLVDATGAQPADKPADAAADRRSAS